MQNQGVAPLFQKPRRRSRNSIVFLFAVLSCLMVFGGGGLLAWQLLSHQGTGGTGGNGAVPATTKAVDTAPNPCKSRLPADNIRQEVAAGLHLSVDQVKDQVHAGKKIQDIATSQGVSQGQLHTLELQAYQDGLAYYQRIGCLHPGDPDYTRDMSYRTETATQLHDDVTHLYDILD